MARLICPESLDFFQSALTALIAGQSVYISGRDFERLTGNDIREFGSEGRLMMGNLAARTNCNIQTKDGNAIFTKNVPPVSTIWHHVSHERHLIDA
jgi:hypothetical protein